MDKNVDLHVARMAQDSNDWTNEQSDLSILDSWEIEDQLQMHEADPIDDYPIDDPNTNRN